jgi:membrane protease YdiL (CAAX protease family)
MHTLSLATDFILAGYVVWEVVRFVPRYRQLKQALANGDTQARVRVYRRAIAFEWVSALLALLALGFNRNKLNPKFLTLDDTWLIQHVARAGGSANQGALAGVFFGVVLGAAILIVARLRSNRHGAALEPTASGHGWRRLLPDFSALIPVTTYERFLWMAVAISAGICEELVFRGWLLSTLHGPLHVQGTALIVIAAMIFGLAHSYQGITGVILTAFAGALLCGLYVATGSLVAPILLHVLMDARFALLPTTRTKSGQTAYA